MSRLASTSARYEAIAAWIVITVIALAIWWFNTLHLVDRLAWDGLSPTMLVAQYRHPAWFTKDYPSGIIELLKSAPMWLYVVGDWARVSAVVLMKGLIGVEIILLAGAAYWFAARYYPASSRVVPVICAIFVISGSLRRCDLARFSDPVYGWVYSYAEAAVLIGLMFAIERRIVWSAILFAIAFICHPILALFGAVFAGAALALNWQRLEFRTFLLAGATFLVVAGGWSAMISASGHLGGGGIPSDMYVAVTRMESMHWYPVTMGLFWERHWERFLPFLTEVLLLLAFLPDQNGRLDERSRQMVAGFLAILLLTIAGVAISLWVPVPMLIKLALHRSSSIALLIGVLIVVPGLWRDATSGPPVRAALATATFVSCFICSYGTPFVLGVTYTGLIAVEEIPKRGWTPRVCLMLALAAGAALLLVGYSIYGIASWRNPQYFGFTGLSLPRLAMVAILISAVALARDRRLVRSVLLLAGIGTLGVLSERADSAFLREPELLVQATDYRAAQLWANQNTPPGTLFMPDPTHFYGWRDFSLRPSFGNSREWLYNAWAYSGDVSAFREGLARVREMGIDLKSYLHLGSPAAANDRLTMDLRNRYYNLDERSLMTLARRHGIAYFVFDRSLRRGPLPRCPIAYQNPHYVILRAACTE